MSIWYARQWMESRTPVWALAGVGIVMVGALAITIWWTEKNRK